MSLNILHLENRAVLVYGEKNIKFDVREYLIDILIVGRCPDSDRLY